MQGGDVEASSDLPQAIQVEQAEVVTDEEQQIQNIDIVTDGVIVRPWYKRWIIWMVIMTFLVFVVIVAVLVSENDSNSSTQPSLQFVALQNLFAAANGAAWTDQNGWNQTDPSTICQWYGITCSITNNVTRIELPHNGLAGDMVSVSEALLPIESLVTLNLQSNELIGNMESIRINLALFPSLRNIDLRVNDIDGGVTDKLCDFTRANEDFQMLYVDCSIGCACCNQTCECEDLVDWRDSNGYNCSW